MKKYWYVVGAFVVILVLSGITFFLTRLLLKPVLCPEKAKGTVVVWNKTDKEVTVIVHTKSFNPQVLDVASGSRACIGLGSKNEDGEEIDPIKYVAVVYEGKKYKFVASQLLNTFYGVTEQSPWPTRYFAVINASPAEVQWSSIKSKGKKSSIKFSEKSDYLILSNYKKLGDVLDDDAVIGAVKVRRKNVCEKR